MDFLARLLLNRERVGLRGIRLELRARERAGILRERHVQPHAEERRLRAADDRRSTRTNAFVSF